MIPEDPSEEEFKALLDALSPMHRLYLGQGRYWVGWMSNDRQTLYSADYSADYETGRIYHTQIARKAFTDNGNRALSAVWVVESSYVVQV